jgi:hypothetical protein
LDHLFFAAMAMHAASPRPIWTTSSENKTSASRSMIDSDLTTPASMAASSAAR